MENKENDFVLFLSRNLTILIGFDPRDIWIGLFWNRPEPFYDLFIYICIVPMFPIKIEYVFEGQENNGTIE